MVRCRIPHLLVGAHQTKPGENGYGFTLDFLSVPFFFNATMRREDIQREIARLDDEINRVVGSAELPKLQARPFPSGTWMLAILCLAWWQFGGYIPGTFRFHLETARWAFYIGLALAAMAFISTVFWMFSGQGYETKSQAYTDASRKARELQERRRDLQSELRALIKD